jgi:hypothetical protein
MTTTTYVAVQQTGKRTTFEREEEARTFAERCRRDDMFTYILEVKTRFLASYCPEPAEVK